MRLLTRGYPEVRGTACHALSIDFSASDFTLNFKGMGEFACFIIPNVCNYLKSPSFADPTS